MLEFDTICFLQNQKTGCTYIETFLRKFCTEGIVRYEKHRAPPVRKEGKFYFASVREPLDAYLSLYNYGLDGKGELLIKLIKQGRRDLYSRGIEGFEAWLDFVLGMEAGGSAAIGLMSYRFLRLAAFGFEKNAATDWTLQQVDDYYQKNRLLNAVIHYENMQQELTQLVHGSLAHVLSDQAQALRWLEADTRINTSTRRDKKQQLTLSDSVREKLQSREAWLYKNFYPEHQ